ncbi:uncharacterized protein [Salvelinus alpinus]|uniref:uncharacterized protein isoform X2 n=1 Tax=Salvelinus alpinus TaxID=8036 RepID=UPI0039FD9E8E
MSLSKRRKVDKECRIFKEKWTTSYLFTEMHGKPSCLVCLQQVSVLKEYNIRRHYETRHSEKYDGLQGQLRRDKINELLAGLRKQQSTFIQSRETLKLKREAAIKAEKTMSKSTYEEEEDEEEDEHLPKTGMSKQDPNTAEVAMTEDGTAEQFEFQYGLEGPTFKNENENGECSKSHLSIIKVEQLDPLLPDQNNSSCGSGSPGDPGPPGSSGFGSSMSPAAQFFRKCHQAGCIQLIFSEFSSRLNTITERISSQQASEEDFNLTLKVLEASGMLPEIFAKRDQEMEKRLKDLQRETEAVRTARSAMRDACVMSFTPS